MRRSALSLVYLLTSISALAAASSVNAQSFVVRCETTRSSLEGSEVKVAFLRFDGARVGLATERAGWLYADCDGRNQVCKVTSDKYTFLSRFGGSIPREYDYIGRQGVEYQIGAVINRDTGFTNFIDVYRINNEQRSFSTHIQLLAHSPDRAECVPVEDPYAQPRF